MRTGLGPATLGTVVFLSLTAQVALADGPAVWDGSYFGAQLGGAETNGCSHWVLPGTQLDAEGSAPSQACGGESLAAGATIGENFQYGHYFWGVSADLNLATARKSTRSWASSASVLPAGAYVASERLEPDGFVVLAPRMGYAGREWAPYIRAGALVAFGGQGASIAYTPPGKTPSGVAFNGGRSFDTIGWAAGGGVEWGLYGPWSIGIEYLHGNLGRGSSTSARCAGTAAACGAFAGITLNDVHDPVTFDTYRVGFNYYFNYW